MYPFGGTNLPVTNMYQADLTYILNEVKALREEIKTPGVRPAEVGGSIITVGKAGCDFTTITDAVAYARTELLNRPVILIAPGIYDEYINISNSLICLYGLGMPTVRSSSTEPTITAAGNIVSGIRFEHHITEYPAMRTPISPSSPNTHFINCEFYATNYRAAVVDGYRDSNWIFDNCEFTSLTTYALGVSNHPVYNMWSQSATFRNCSFNGLTKDVVISDSTEEPGTVSVLNVSFPGCTGKNNAVSVVYDLSGQTTGYVPPTGNIKLQKDSINTLTGVDYNNRIVKNHGIRYCNAGATCVIPMNNANMYDWDFLEAPKKTDSSAASFSTYTVTGATDSGISVYIAASSGLNVELNMIGRAK